MSRVFTGKPRTINVKHVLFGGEQPVIIAGPCSVESKEGIMEIALMLKPMGIHVLRGGVFKPRTNPYDFQGLGYRGLEYLKEAADAIGVPFITELMDENALDAFVEMVDIIQVGSRNMYNYSLLKAIGKTQKPVLLKRGMSATINEWIMAAEYLASEGNPNVILCERGIRTFDSYTRNTLDLSAVPIMKMETGLPVIVDPSHGTGRRELIVPMSKAALACGADGLMIEVHPAPDCALSDGPQSLDYGQFQTGLREIETFIKRG
jgi:3-deoxy-7-phosphoheptulonate synthase